MLEELERHACRRHRPDHLESLLGRPGLIGVDAQGDSGGHGAGDGLDAFDVERHRPAYFELQGAEPLVGPPGCLGRHDGGSGQAQSHVRGDRAGGGSQQLRQRDRPPRRYGAVHGHVEAALGSGVPDHGRRRVGQGDGVIAQVPPD